MKAEQMALLQAERMTEKDLLEQVRQLAHALGWLSYHTHSSVRSEPGFPDLVLVGPTRVLYRELKSEMGKVSPTQKHWIDRLAATGVDVDVWWPHDLIEGKVAAELGYPRGDPP